MYKQNASLTNRDNSDSMQTTTLLRNASSDHKPQTKCPAGNYSQCFYQSATEIGEMTV